jgi:hypothetical protein
MAMNLAKCQVLCAEVLLCTKGDWRAYTTYGVCSLAGHDPVEGLIVGGHLDEVEVHFLSVFVKMMFKLLPPSMRVLGRNTPSVMGLMTSG